MTEITLCMLLTELECYVMSSLSQGAMYCVFGLIKKISVFRITGNFMEGTHSHTYFFKLFFF